MMDVKITSKTYADLPESTRLWVYQSDQPLPAEQREEVRGLIERFAQQWVSHNQQLTATGDLLFDRFLLLMVDESSAGASGCSIDSSVAFVKALQAEYGVDFFDRMRFSFQDEKGQVQTLPREEFSAWYQAGKITDDTLVFDTLVKNKAEFETAFIKPLKDSWHARMV